MSEGIGQPTLSAEKVCSCQLGMSIYISRAILRGSNRTFNFVENKSAFIGPILSQSNAGYTLKACSPILAAFR